MRSMGDSTQGPANATATLTRFGTVGDRIGRREVRDHVQQSGVVHLEQRRSCRRLGLRPATAVLPVRAVRPRHRRSLRGPSCVVVGPVTSATGRSLSNRSCDTAFAHGRLGNAGQERHRRSRFVVSDAGQCGPDAREVEDDSPGGHPDREPWPDQCRRVARANDVDDDEASPSLAAVRRSRLGPCRAAAIKVASATCAAPSDKAAPGAAVRTSRTASSCSSTRRSRRA